MNIQDLLLSIQQHFANLEPLQQQQLADIYLNHIMPSRQQYALNPYFHILRAIILKHEKDAREQYLDPMIVHEKLFAINALIEPEQAMLQAYMTDYFDAIYQNCCDVSKDFIDKIVFDQYSQLELKNLSRNVKTIIFYELCFDALVLQLTKIKKGQASATSALSEDEVLLKTKQLYRHFFFDESIYITELSQLILHKANLSFKKAFEEVKITRNDLSLLVALNDEIKPELEFVTELLKNGDNVSTVKLSATDRLKTALSLSEDHAFENLCPNTLNDLYDRFMKEQGCEPVNYNARFIGNVKVRTTKQYFEPDNNSVAPSEYFTSVKKELLQKLTAIEGDLSLFTNLNLPPSLESLLNQPLTLNTLAKSLNEKSLKPGTLQLQLPLKILQNSQSADESTKNQASLMLFLTGHINLDDDNIKNFMLALIKTMKVNTKTGVDFKQVSQLQAALCPSLWQKIGFFCAGISQDKKILATHEHPHMDGKIQRH